ncbi:MAG: Amylopullulanase, GH57 family [uncultured bacterium]|nr:MAG: Amylopullulanase, GH57 family [uncultured bacterium]
MPMSLAQPQKTNRFPSYLIYILAIACVGLIVYFGGSTIKNLFKLKGVSALTVTNTNEEAQVFVNDTLLGNTPIEAKEVKSGENKVTIKTSSRTYETTISFLPNTHIILNRDLAISDNFSSGQNFWMEKASSQSVLNVTSEPVDAGVFIDNTEVGKTPYSSSTLTPGEYDLRVSLSGYEDQTARIKIQKGYNLNVAVKLFPQPTPAKVNAFEGSTSLYDGSSANSVVTSDLENWAKAVYYWNKTRGINVAELGVNKEPIFDFFLDYQGNMYTKEGVAIVNPSGYELIKDAKKGLYLGKTADGAGLSEQAKATYETFTKGTYITGSKTATIKDTGLGWLRVRDIAGLTGKEIAKVDVGKVYTVLEEQPEWIKIKVSETISGWVSKTYVQLSQ